MKGHDVYDVKETKESLHIIRKKYNQTKLDDGFQRRGGMERGSGWTLKAAEEYNYDRRGRVVPSLCCRYWG